MTMIARIAFAAALAATFVGSAQAQRPQPGQPGGGGFGGDRSLRGMLHTSKPLQEELKLTEDQIAKFKTFAEKNAPPMGMGMGPGGFGGGGFGGGGFGGGSDLDTLESLKTQIKVVEERVEFVKTTLTKEQAERFAQLETQRLGVRAFSNARIAKELKITDDQKKRIAEVNADLQKEQRALFGGGAGGRPDAEKLAENAKKSAQLSEYAMEAIEKELTGEQKNQWAKMVGTKFDMSKLSTRTTTNN